MGNIYLKGSCQPLLGLMLQQQVEANIGLREWTLNHTSAVPGMFMCRELWTEGTKLPKRVRSQGSELHQLQVMSEDGGAQLAGSACLIHLLTPCTEPRTSGLTHLQHGSDTLRKLHRCVPTFCWKAADSSSGV